MIVNREKLGSRKQTADKIYEWAEKFNSDLAEFDNWTLGKFYDFVHSYPFKEDPRGFEIIARPLYLLDDKYFESIDCKKKTVLLAAFFERHGWDYRLLGVSDDPSKPAHHIFPLLWNGEDWIEVDATLPEDYIGKEYNWYNVEIF